MKRLLTLLLLFSVACFALTSCGDDSADDKKNEQPTPPDGDDEDNRPDDGDISTLMPGEHQKKLEDVAKQFVANFNANDQKELIESLSKLSSYIGDRDEEATVECHYFIHLALGYYKNVIMDLRGLPGEQVSVASTPDFITRAEFRYHEAWQTYVLDIDADLNKMQLTGNVEGFIVLRIAGDGDEQRFVNVGVLYSDGWTTSTDYYGDNGEGRFRINSPFLVENLSKIELTTYGKEGYFKSVGISAVPDDPNMAEISYSVNRNIAGSYRGRIDLFLAEEKIFSVDVKYDSYYETDNAAWLKKSGTLAMLRGAADMSVTSVAEFMASVASKPDYTFDLNRLKGLEYVYDNDSEEWIETDKGNDEIVFKWDDCQTVITWSNSNKTWEGKVDFDQAASVRIPESINISVKIGGKEHLGVKLSPGVKDNYTMTPQAVVSLNGGYAFTVDASASSKGVQASVTVAKNSAKLASAKAYMSINDLTDTDNWFEQETYTWTDGYGVEHTEHYNYEVLDKYIGKNAKTGEASIDILSVSVYAKGDIRAIVTGSNAIDDVNSESGAIKYAELINKNIEAYMYYNDQKAKVADIMVQPYLEDGYDWNEPQPNYPYYNASRAYDEESWGQEPVLVFPDGSKFAFEDYFTSQKFSSLIDAVGELIDAYRNIVENAEEE